MRFLPFTVPVLLLGCALLAQDAPQKATDSVTELGGGRAVLKPFTRIAHKRIDECSGLEFHQGAWWTHNDSGGRPVLYRSKSPDFAEAQELAVPGAEAIDWQEITSLGDDLLVCDIGDSALRRDDLKVYRIRYVADAPKPIQLVAACAIAYPDGRHDAKAAFVVQGKLHIITSPRGGKETALYRFDKLTPQGSNVGVRVGALDLHRRETITAADYDEATGTLALLSYTSIYTYNNRGAPGPAFTGKPASRVLIEARQCEALCFHDGQLVFANEQRDLYTVDDFLKRKLKSLLSERAGAKLPAAKGEFSLSGDGSAWAAKAGSLSLRNSKPGEYLRWLINGEDLLICGRMIYAGAFNSTREEADRLGSVLMLMFATEAGGNLTGREFHLAVGDNGRTGVDLWQLDLDGEKIKLTSLEAATVKGKVAGSRFDFELRVPLKLIFGKSVAPESFLFNAWGYSLHGENEVHFAGQSLASFLRPYTWGDVTLTK